MNMHLKAKISRTEFAGGEINRSPNDEDSIKKIALINFNFLDSSFLLKVRIEGERRKKFFLQIFDSKIRTRRTWQGNDYITVIELKRRYTEIVFKLSNERARKYSWSRSDNASLLRSYWTLRPEITCGGSRPKFDGMHEDDFEGDIGTYLFYSKCRASWLLL